MNAPTVVFAWRRTPPPLLIGGAEVSQQLLAEEFARAGWNVVYLGSHEAPWDSSPRIGHLRAHLLAHGVGWEEQGGEIRYSWNGVACAALPQDRIEKEFARLLSDLAPELVITSQEGSSDLAATARARTTVAGWLHSVSSTGLGVLAGSPHHALATSRFVASRARPAPRTKVTVFYPPYSPATMGEELPRLARDGLLMVNPIPAKGSCLLHQLVERLPQQQFTLVEGWWDTAREFTGYPNVTYVPRTYTMGPLYAAHQLLLVPSQVEDAFPRVIAEAGLHGVPALGSDRGGIPEAIGPGGIVLPPDDTDAWVAAINTDGHEQLGAAARTTALPLTRPCLPELAAAGVIPPLR
ncbi:glycosyltransferase [Streptomyces sp. NPDC058157]|uniref:glycosyltransferase n=1 Tax=Streptomyces sp. NPDC058157 TaxID=3346360 RepID=UPI0036EBE873